ncbi:MAG: homocitrate synthase [Tepidisphaerales bacterium]
MSEPTTHPDHVELIDTTLRDGAQSPGVVFTRQQRLAIAGALADAGIDEIEAGSPAMGEDECNAIRDVVRLRLACRVTAWCRAREEDIDSAATMGVPAVHLSFPISAILLRALRKCESWLLDELERLVPIVRRRFEFVSIGVQDAARADRQLLLRFARRAADLGVHRLRLADSVGVWHPQAVRRVFRCVHRAAPGLQLGAHMHEDLGMATANSLSALQSGASSADVTVLGIGERAGNAPLEQLAIAAGFSGLRCRVRPERLGGLCRLVATAARRPIPPNQPIVGQAIFDHESGIHVQAILRDPRSYEPFAPETVGRTGRRLLVGRHSGAASLHHALVQLGIDTDETTIRELLPHVRRLAESKRGPLTPTELRDLFHSLTRESAEGVSVHSGAPQAFAGETWNGGTY